MLHVSLCIQYRFTQEDSVYLHRGGILEWHLLGVRGFNLRQRNCRGLDVTCGVPFGTKKDFFLVSGKRTFT